MPDSGKASDAIAEAWDVLHEVVAVRVAKGHNFVLLGDFNARVGSATAPDMTIGQHGEAAPPNLAGRALIDMLSASGACILNSRTPGDNITFSCGDMPRSILDYAIVPSEMYHAGASAVAGGAAWHIQGSGHVPVVATVPV